MKKRHEPEAGRQAPKTQGETDINRGDNRTIDRGREGTGS